MYPVCAGHDDGAPASRTFRWFEQDSCDELAQEALAWASMEEAVLPQMEERLVNDVLPVCE
jgi:hypothetical protein